MTSSSSQICYWVSCCAIFSLQFIASILFLQNSGEDRTCRCILMHFCCIQKSKKEGALKEKVPISSFILVLPFLFISHVIPVITAWLPDLSPVSEALGTDAATLPSTFFLLPRVRAIQLAGSLHPSCCTAWHTCWLNPLLSVPAMHLGLESLLGRSQSKESLQRHRLNSSGCFLSLPNILLSHIIKLFA